MSVQDLTRSIALTPKSPKRNVARLGAWTLALTVLLVGCDPQNIDRRDRSETGSSLNGDTQVITQTGSDNQRVAEVSVPSGALAINQELSVEPGFHTDTEEIHSEFNIGSDNEITPAGVATVVSSNIDSNLGSPMTIAVDLPASGAGLLGLFGERYFFVVYTVRDSVAQAWKRGIVPAASVTIADDKLTFTTKLMGKYEVFQAAKPIDPPKTERVISKPELVAPPVAVTKVTPLVAIPNQLVMLRGKYFSAKTTVSVGNLKLGNVTVESSNVITFPMPEIFGLKTITVAEASNKATAEVIGQSTNIDRPVLGLNPDLVCIGIGYYDFDGNPHEGTRKCDYNACQNSGDTGCIATAEVPALKKSTIPVDQIVMGTGILGRMGTYDPYSNTAPPNCQTDGATGCMATTQFPAVNKANVAAINLRTGTTVAGVAGVLADCNLDGGTYCVAMPDFPAADKNSITASDIRSGKTIANINGSLDYCSVDGAVDCVANHNYKAANMVDAISANIRVGVNIAGVTGNMASAPSSCATGGQTACVTTSAFPSIEIANLSPGIIKNGTTIAGVTGEYPSNTYPLQGYQPSATQLTSAFFDQKARSPAQFQFWDRNGTLQTAQGSDQITPQNILSGVTIFGVAGSATPLSAVQPSDLRAGINIGGISGELKADCRNSAKLATYQHDAAGAVLNAYDTVPDDVLPDVPAERPWGDTHHCAGELWLDKTSVSGNAQACTAIDPNCMWQNTITKTYWAGDSSTSGRTWQNAVDHCNTLDASGKSSGWRLPTQKELMSAYTHGFVWIAGTNNALKGSLPKYWSATVNTVQDTERYVINLRTGVVESLGVGNDAGTICVHD